MDPNVTIATIKLSELIRDQAEKAKTEEVRVALTNLATDIGDYIAHERAPTFNVPSWLQSCGITPDFKRTTAA